MKERSRREMDALQARALLFQRKLQEFPVDISLPGLEELDNQLSVLEMTGADTTNANKLVEGPDGKADGMAQTAAVICKALILRETKERIFTDNDIEAVVHFGLTILTPLSQSVAKASGGGVTAIEAAKKNSSTIPVSGSNTSSPENSAEVSPSQS